MSGRRWLTSGVHQGSILEPILFNTVINDIGWLSAPSFAEWYGWHAWGMGCHSERPGKASQMGLRELHEVQQGQMWDPAHGSGQAVISVQGVGLKSTLPRRPWVYWWVKIWMWVNSVHLQPRNSWAASQEAWPAGQERWFCCLTCVSTRLFFLYKNSFINWFFSPNFNVSVSVHIHLALTVYVCYTVYAKWVLFCYNSFNILIHFSSVYIFDNCEIQSVHFKQCTYVHYQLQYSLYWIKVS